MSIKSENEMTQVFDEDVQTIKKRTISDEIYDKYWELAKNARIEIKELFANKFDHDSDSRFQRLFTTVEAKREVPTPKEDYYLTKVIDAYYAHQNGDDEIMSFEEIQNL